MDTKDDKKLFSVVCSMTANAKLLFVLTIMPRSQQVS